LLVHASSPVFSVHPDSAKESGQFKAVRFEAFLSAPSDLGYFRPGLISLQLVLHLQIPLQLFGSFGMGKFSFN
jgi:hypothetical protein